MRYIEIKEAPLARFMFANTGIAWFWLIVRIYVGWQWISAGWEKLHSAAWVGANAGSALSGFVQGALTKAVGTNPDVQGWYATFLRQNVLSHAVFWSHLIVWGELLVGIALIIGFLTGIAAFFGLFMNFNYLLAGTVSINPILFVLAIGLMFAWRVAGYYGADKFFLPWLGTPWKPGKAFHHH